MSDKKLSQCIEVFGDHDWWIAFPCLAHLDFPAIEQAFGSEEEAPAEAHRIYDAIKQSVISELMDNYARPDWLNQSWGEVASTLAARCQELERQLADKEREVLEGIVSDARAALDVSDYLRNLPDAVCILIKGRLAELEEQGGR